MPHRPSLEVKTIRCSTNPSSLTSFQKILSAITSRGPGSPCYTVNKMGGMSAGFAGKFVQPGIECGAIFRRGLSKTHAHSEARVRVDHARCEIACAATVADADLQLRAIGKRIDRIHVATKQAQFGNARDESLSISDFRNPGLGDKRKSRVAPAHRIL